ncbi:TonB-dependent receptor plug domain-containing protein [Sulfurimonas sp.]|uniref:TonB-dependent receptor plug domain-containing protein n=1 Tax=Sulfurimonas sp. TaxID=2022749 RepID=UPI0035688322
MKKSLLVLSAAATFALAEGSYTLGQVSVGANTADDINMIEESISSDTISRDSSLIVSEALDNISGINQDVQGGRGEGTLYIRGFDAKRIGVFIDGIPIYVPYDGNFDYVRFLTSDVAKIDISKGYSSVAYGGNTMGGVVNIVSKKPTKELEGNIKATMVLDSNTQMARHIETLNVGTMLDGFYAQLGASYSKQNHFRMSDDFQAVDTQPEGERLRSESEDKKVSLKAGYVADDMSEVAVNYANQKGKKQQPPVTDTDFAKSKNWDWPYWNKETISITGQKNFGASYIKALAYYDKSENSLYSYDDDTFRSFTQKWAWKSRYDDYSYGARLEYATEFGSNFLKVAANYKKDVHRGYDIEKDDSGETLTERYKDYTVSVGIEDIYTISSSLQLLAGINYDRRKGQEIFDTNDANLDMLNLTSEDALSPQAALIYALDSNSKVRGSISRKTYMPSMKDRYSRKLGTAVPNVNLKNEIATHYELGYTRVKDSLSTGVNVYYTRVKDAIQNNPWDQNTSLSQNQNVGTFDHRGIELDVEYSFDGTDVGGNYSYINIKDTKNTGAKIVDVPKHQLFAYARQEVGAGFAVYANMKVRKGAYENKMDATFVINPTFTTYDLKVIYNPLEEFAAEIGVKNLSDKLVRYDYAYPMAGREFFASLEYKF